MNVLMQTGPVPTSSVATSPLPTSPLPIDPTAMAGGDGSAGSDAIADGGRIVYEFSRAASLDGWWVWALLVIGLAAAAGLAMFFYRRDVAELSRPVRWTLMGLRFIAIASLVFIYFNLVRRTERRITRDSEVVVLVDVSQSMSLPSGPAIDAVSRAEIARTLVGESQLAQKFAAEHRTSVYVFDQQTEPRLIQTLRESPGDGDPDSDSDSNPGDMADSDAGTTPTITDPIRSPFAVFGVFCLVAAGVLAVISLMLGALGSRQRISDSSVTIRRGEESFAASPLGWALLASAIAMVCGIVSLGGVYAARTDQTFAQIVGWATTTSTEPAPALESESGPLPADALVAPANDPSSNQRDIDWSAALAATGTQSRIGDALRSVLMDHDASTLAGVVLITDGQNNGGTSLASALATARRGEVSVYPVGLGSSQPPTNVRVVDLEAPRRVYPGDKFAVSAVLQATGDSAIEVDVELVDALDNGNEQSTAPETIPGGDAATASTSLPGGEVLERQRVRLEPDATLAGIRFEIEPQTVGRRRLAVRVVAPPEDRNASDDMRTARYEVVARKLRVLAIAGGPTREYRFVRNLLYRDASTRLDVWLQTGQPGISQDADELLTRFPETADELFEYDAIMMFDPDWSAIDSSSLDLLDRFLTQQAGGLVLVAGPVYHPRLGGQRADARTSQISGFFPVNLSTRGPLLGGGRQGGEDAWPLKFTAEALQTEFLWVADSPEASFERWNEFTGVYDYVGVKSPKPGAKVYAYFADPTTEIGGSLPVFMASQFYGAGRVFFQGSGEMWRLRSAGDRYFDAYFTKLIRWVSEGRLLRDSNRGVLLVDSARAMVGQTITLRAVLVDEQFQPLTDPEVTAKWLTPDGKIKDLRLTPAADAPGGGTYTGNFVVTSAGGHDIQLTIGDGLDEQILRQSIQVRLPTSELERPRRADDAMQQLASATRGRYFPVGDPAAATMVAAELTSAIAPQPQVTVLAGTPDDLFNERRNAGLMWLIASVLTFEWLVRRLHKLA